MRRLTDLPNIGIVLARRLSDAGIRTPSDLRRLGSVEAARRVRRDDENDAPCANMLYALEGAIRNVRWRTIAADERKALWRRYKRGVGG